MPVESRHI
jgi:hypothetical protein